MFIKDNKFFKKNQIKNLKGKRNINECNSIMVSDFLPYEIQKIDL